MKPVEKIKSLAQSAVGRITRKVINPLTDFLEKVDAAIRKFDWKNDRNYSPEPINCMHVQGQAASISYLMIIIPVFLILGPSLGATSSMFALFLLVVFSLLAFYLHRIVADERSLFWIQAGSLFGLSLFLWFSTAPETTERSGQIYRHLLIPLLWIFLGIMILSRSIAKWFFGKYKNSRSYIDYLKRVELFYSTRNSKPNVTLKAYIRSVLTTPFYHPVQLLYFPSLAVLFIANRDLMPLVASIVFVLTWLYIAASDVHIRLSMILDVLKGKLFIGAQLVVSLVVIILAIGRWLEISYINTLIESHPDRVNFTLLAYIAVAYAFFWFFEYWINRPLLEQIINIFREKTDNNNLGRINYPAEYTSTSVKKDGRFIQIHGGARLAVVGVNKHNEKENWHTYQRTELFETLFSKLDMTDDAVFSDYQQYHSIKQRMRAYFLLINFLLVGALTVMTLNYMKLPQKPAFQAKTHQPDDSNNPLFDLNQRLFTVTKSEKKQDHAILLAASGGGTRAALYTESVLRGLNQNGLLDKLVLASGVSGGSAALAYFAAHRDKLINGDEKYWEEFSQTMAEPFIQDVLEGITEWRVIGGSEQTDRYTNKRFRMGMRLADLLAESFEARFNLDKAKTRKKIGEQPDIGLIFNTALVAEFPRWPCDQLGQHDEWNDCNCSGKIPIAKREKSCSVLSTKINQGGRLVFTNLKNISKFPDKGLDDARGDYLKYVFVQDGTAPLVRAAALSANFPPVFPNSAVDIDGENRYWVTDGGATDNRGILSLLYALKSAVVQEEMLPKKRTYPTIHVVIADASATNLSFNRETGLSAKFGAPARFASQLMVDLANDIEKRYAKIGGKVIFHSLAMPLTLRSNGGLGTHWMLPANVSFKTPLNVTKSGNLKTCKKQSLSGVETRNLIDKLHSSKNHNGKISENQKAVWSWVCKDNQSNHQKVWKKFIKDAKGEEYQNTYCERLTERAECQ